MNIIEQLREFADYCHVQSVEWDAAGDDAKRSAEWTSRARLLNEAADEMEMRDRATYKVVQKLVEAQNELKQQSPEGSGDE